MTHVRSSPTHSAIAASDHRRGAHPAAAENAEDAWWFGFSCAGRSDLVPEPDRAPNRPLPRVGVDEPVYRTEAFVHSECRRLAMQLETVARGRSPRDADPGPTRLSRIALGGGR